MLLISAIAAGRGVGMRFPKSRVIRAACLICVGALGFAVVPTFGATFAASDTTAPSVSAAAPTTSLGSTSSDTNAAPQPDGLALGAGTLTVAVGGAKAT